MPAGPEPPTGAKAMAWRVTLAVLAVALTSVVFGLEWRSAPVPPPRATALQQPIVFPPPPSVPPLALPAAPPQPANPESTAAAPSAAEADQARAQAPAVTAPPGCNVSACEAAYRSFNAADCTYQPFDGPRRLCRRK